MQVLHENFTDVTKCLKHESLYSQRYSCKRCPEKSATVQLLLKHCKEEHPKEQCHICNSFYERKEDLEKHIAEVHKRAEIVTCEKRAYT